MTKQSFLSALAWQLTLAGVPYVRPDLEAFVDDVWPLAEDRPDVGAVGAGVRRGAARAISAVSYGRGCPPLGIRRDPRRATERPPRKVAREWVDEPGLRRYEFPATPMAQDRQTADHEHQCAP
jgi:hypothetical protein